MGVQAQHFEALQLANEIRNEGARIRRAMGAQPSTDSRRVAAELLRDPPDAIARMRVGHFLSGIRRCGRHRAIRFMQQAGLTIGMWERRIGPVSSPINHPRHSLSARQREALAVVLDRAPGGASDVGGGR